MSHRVVLPLMLSGEALKYPGWFAELGIEFEAKWCPSEQEAIALAKDADAVIVEGSQRPMTRVTTDVSSGAALRSVRGWRRSRAISLRWMPVTSDTRLSVTRLRGSARSSSATSTNSARTTRSTTG